MLTWRNWKTRLLQNQVFWEFESPLEHQNSFQPRWGNWKTHWPQKPALSGMPVRRRPREPFFFRFSWVCSSTRQSSGLQSRRLEVRFFPRPPAISGGVPQWSKGADCKSACVSTRQFESDHRLHLIAFSACSSARTERRASTPVCRPFESVQARHIPHSNPTQGDLP